MGKIQKPGIHDFQVISVESGAHAFALAKEIAGSLKSNAAVVITGPTPEGFQPCSSAKFAGHETTFEPGLIYAAPVGKSLSVFQKKAILTEATANMASSEHFLLDQLRYCGTQGMIAVDPNYKIAWFNQIFFDLYKKSFDIEVVKGASILDYARTTDKEGLKKLYDIVFSGKDVERTMSAKLANSEDLHVDIRYRPMRDEKGNVQGALATVRDISEVTLHKELPEKKEKLYKALLENSGEAVAIMNAEGKAIYVSASVEGLLGYSVEEAMQIDLFGTLHPEDVPRVQKVLEESMQTPGKAIQGGTARMRLKNGTYRYFDATITNMFHEPDIGGIVNNFRDVTDTFLASAQTDFERRVRDSLINNTKDLIWSVDKNYRLLAANDSLLGAMKYLTGRSPEIGDSMISEKYYPKPFLEMWQSMYDRCLAGETIELVTSDPESDGKSSSVYDTSISPIQENGEVIGVACFAHDVTESKRQQKLLRERNTFIEAALENLPIGIAVNKIDNGETILINKMFGSTYGWPLEKLTNTETFFKRVYPDPDYRAEITSMVMEDMKSGDIDRMAWQEIKITTESGEERLINARNIPLPNQNQMISTVIDVTEAVRAREALRQSNERYELLTKVSFDAIWDLEVHSKEIFWGGGMKENFGHEFENDTSTVEQWEALVHPDDKFHTASSFKAALKNPDADQWGADYRMVKSDGTYADVMDRGFLIRNEKGVLVRAVGAVQDITAQKVYEKNLVQLNTRLKKRAKELAESNAELEQFAYVASHDLQEPLRMVTSFLTQIEKKYNDVLDDAGRQYIHYATDGAKRMRQIILDLLEYSRVGRAESGHCDVDPRDCVDNAVKMLKESIEETAAEIYINELPPVIKANPTQVVQMYQNLLSNAIKYRNEGVAPKIKIGYTESPESFEFYVKDNGIGIKPEFFEKIFSIFQRLHVREKYTGTGIGLAICKKIAETHQGQIRVESEEECGSTFYFTIPKK
ncbi:MAG: PAS domain S-box protein [Flavobacteriales bacterium]|nr:PAS domain S-box protein [Flavobacteriales bacterium]